MLRDTFKLAESWSAIVVLHEADAYVSTRTPTDIKHDSMVSGRRLSAAVSHILCILISCSLPSHFGSLSWV